jgi:outer membrane lipoprotein-sorting protein
VGRDTLEGQILLKLQLAAKERTTRMRQLFLWVNTDRWTVERFETIPYEGRSLFVTFHQTALENGVFLPDTMRAEFGIATGEPDTLSGVYQYKPQLREMLGQVRSGSMTVVYSNYRINIGLPDNLFEKKPEEQKPEEKKQ